MSDITAAEIRKAIGCMGDAGNILIPEFTWTANRQAQDIRIDALLVEVRKRWIRGFEIKTRREDFLGDDKWHLYTEFCSSISIACPAGLIKREEVKPPFGLLYVTRSEGTWLNHRWERKPKRFQQGDGLAWMWTYMRVIERELPRLNGELIRLNNELDRCTVSRHKRKEPAL